MTEDAPPQQALQHAPWPTEYDRAHLAIYASLLGAEKDGLDWRIAAQTLLQLDVDSDEAAAHAIWKAHLERARWFWTADPR